MRVLILMVFSVLIFGACGKSQLDDVAGKSYFIREDGYTCNPMTGGAAIPSHKDSIRFDQTALGLSVCQTGDACNDFITCTQATDKNVQVKDGGQAVEYRGKTYSQ